MTLQDRRLAKIQGLVLPHFTDHVDNSFYQMINAPTSRLRSFSDTILLDIHTMMPGFEYFYCCAVSSACMYTIKLVVCSFTSTKYLYAVCVGKASTT